MLVSIMSITYNHEPFLVQALESFLAQKTSFEVEIVIGDDCSTDKTRDILLQYKERYPDKFRLLLHEKNMGMMANWIQTFQACRGKYIAVCEGDDYWIDENKLQQQVDFLEKNSGFTICSHSSYDLIDGKLEPSDRWARKNVQHFYLTDYLLQPFFHTSSIMVRKMDIFPPWYYNVLAGDNFLVLFFASYGDIYYIPKTMSVYRVHKKSISNRFQLKALRENYAYHLKEFSKLTNGKYEKEIRTVIKKWELNTKWTDKPYFRKLGFFISNFSFYLKNYHRFFNFKLLVKYIIPTSLLELKRRY